MKDQTQSTSSIKAVSAALIIGLVLGGVGGCVLAQVKGPTDMKGVSVDELGIVSEESLRAQLGIEGFILRIAR